MKILTLVLTLVLTGCALELVQPPRPQYQTENYWRDMGRDIRRLEKRCKEDPTLVECPVKQP